MMRTVDRSMDLTASIRHEDGMYWAEVTELPGCFASGDTVTELIEALEEAVSLYLTDSGEGPVATTISTVGLHADRAPQQAA